MNMVGQNSPWGSLDYQQTGTRTILDPKGKPIDVPSYTANVTLSPTQQAIFDKSQATEGNLAQIAQDQSEWLGDYLKEPFSFNNGDAEQWAYDLGAKRLDPRFAQQEEALRTQLVNSGIRPGTAAYNSEMSRLGESKNDAYNNLMLQGRSQAFSEALTQRNQPLNEIIGLMSGTQVQSPTGTFAGAPQSQVAGVDYTGLVNQKYQGELNSYNSMMGGLFGLGGTIGLGAMKYSDRRLKTNIREVGRLHNGLTVYAYRMVDGGPEEIGLMADEVAAFAPDAVAEAPNGFLKVHYGRATEMH